MKKIQLTFALSMIAMVHAFSVNLVSNGTFEYSTANYAWYGSNTSPGTQNFGTTDFNPIAGSKSARIEVTASGGSAQNLSVNTRFALAKGATYKISFKAKATHETENIATLPMTVKVTNLTATGTAVTTQTVTMNSTAQSYELTFANANLCGYNFLQFQYGNFPAGTLIFLDDVSIVEITKPLTNGNLCNGDMEADMASGTAKQVTDLAGYRYWLNYGWEVLVPSSDATFNAYSSSAEVNLISEIGVRTMVLKMGTTPGDNNASHMLGWAFTPAVGKKYTISFKAKTDMAAGFNAGIKLVSRNGSIVNFDNPTGIALTTSPQTFTFTSNTISDYDFYYVLCFQVGTLESGKTVLLDDVELYQSELETPTVNTASSITGTGFMASWNAIPRAESYDVLVYQGENLVKTVNATGQSTTNLEITGLSPNTTYTYTVVAKGNNNSTFDSPESVASAEFSSTLTGVEMKNVLPLQVWVKNGEVVVKRNDEMLKSWEFEIYNSLGQKINSYRLGTGLYIVKAGEQTTKVFVR